MLLAFLLALGFIHAAGASGWNLKDKDDVHYTLSSLRGKWVLVNFWAPWCTPCLEEMSGLTALQQQHNDVQVIGVAVMYQNRNEVQNTMNAQSITYPIVFGNEDIAGEFGGLDGLPTSFLYTPSGKLVGHHQGILTRNQIEQVIKREIRASDLFSR
ncbi:MAG: TlpA disulfide reductase family protein [Pseudomonadota bacterium]